MAASTPSVSCPFKGLVPFGHSALADTTGPGSWIALLFPLSLPLSGCRFPLSIQKEKKRRGGYAAERAVPIPRFWGFDFFFTFLAVARKKESERLGHNGLPVFSTLLCVLGSMLIDGLHIPIVTSLRRLSTVGCGGMGAMCLKNGLAARASPERREGTAGRIDTSPRDYYYYCLVRTGQTFWDRNSSCEIIRRRTGWPNLGCVVGWEGCQRCCLICVQVFWLLEIIGGGGETRGITEPCLLDVLWKMYNHVLSAWLWLVSSDQKGRPEPYNPNQIYLYIHIYIHTHTRCLACEDYGTALIVPQPAPSCF